MDVALTQASLRYIDDKSLTNWVLEKNRITDGVIYVCERALAVERGNIRDSQGQYE